MAVWTSTLIGRSVWGNKAVTFGTYQDLNSDGGGDINTGLNQCEKILLQPFGGAVTGNASAINETLPVAGSAVTIVCDAAQTGTWFAIGDSFA
jgi:hypothetical protein